MQYVDGAKGVYTIVIHGGAGSFANLTDRHEKEAYLEGLRNALEIGQQVLANGGMSLDAVEKAVIGLENNTMFNCGKGSVFNHEGFHELDAAIMDGRTLACGAVAGVKTVKNPITLARMVMEKTEHILLAGEGADKFGQKMNVEQVSQDYYFYKKRYKQWQESLKMGITQLDHSSKEKMEKEKMGTVGAVALDIYGNLAAATSTGGVTNKKFGRVGDSPIIGAGTYANNETCAISCTGKGEHFIRILAAHEVHALMKYTGCTLKKAVNEVVYNQLPIETGGIIAVDRFGNMEAVFNTNGMLRGKANHMGLFEVGIF